MTFSKTALFCSSKNAKGLVCCIVVFSAFNGRLIALFTYNTRLLTHFNVKKKLKCNFSTFSCNTNLILPFLRRKKKRFKKQALFRLCRVRNQQWHVGLPQTRSRTKRILCNCIKKEQSNSQLLCSTCANWANF